ncbi:hypothetical protein FB45DRAFT_519412 [Roridomyces roridus]|uniref:Uncharacterized protein n=1 Tax=Roridomyces roridus TaxID=1738132 RepID=A0AAD7FQV6_9AGAR|nr:hypothetical protein FB45DRAFT_519412 [Roridomyces roridus]
MAGYRTVTATQVQEDPVPSEIDLGGSIGRVALAVTLLDENRDEDVLEKPLFSDIVFRGLRLSDKHALAEVKFQLPTTRFSAPNLTKSDLRATFFLLPTSPSLIDHVKNFSSWMPDSVFAQRRPTRPWPFPLGSAPHGEKTIADLALESFSISVPLLEFHNISSRCNTDEIVENHPYIVTRTQLRVVRETRLFDAKAYNAVRDEIKRHSCGQGIPGIKPHLRMCRRTYKSNGNFETRLELEVPTESGFETQWAYAPYLDTKAHSAGPLDIIPVPVDRDNCSSTPQNESMEVVWRIAYAGRSPGKQLWADQFVSPYIVDPHASDLMKASQQTDAELWNGAMGHRFHDEAHPRRRITITFVSGGCQIIAALLLFHYWWTRVSTVGISPSSVVFIVAGTALAAVGEAIEGEGIISLLTLIIPLLMCKAILRVEFGWNRWYPTVKRAPANHAERTSQRLDSLTGWRLKLGILATHVLMYQLVDKISLLASTVPAARHGEYGPEKPLLRFLGTFSDGLILVGVYCQVLLNHKYRAYGGGYRAETIIYSFGRLSDLLYFVPVVVGRMEMRMGLTLKPLLDIFLQLPLVLQAMTLPAVKGDDEDT